MGCARTCSGDMYSDRSQDAPRTGQLRLARHGRRRLTSASGPPEGCQAEVKNLGVPPARDEEIRRLDIAVDDSGGVRCIERVGHLDRKRQ